MEEISIDKFHKTICTNCSLMQKTANLPPGHYAKCPRCGSILESKHKGAVNKALALTLTCLILFIPASLDPLLTLNILGETKSANLFTGVNELAKIGFPMVAVVVFLFSILMPFLKHTLFMYVLTGLYIQKPFPYSIQIFKAYTHIDIWAMQEVYLLGILVALTKIDSIANVKLEAGFYFFSALTIISIAASTAVSESEIWKKLEKISHKKNSTQNNAVICATCKKINYIKDNKQKCTRCNSLVGPRKDNAITKTWALLIAALIFYIPANVYPIMQYSKMEKTTYDTIISGVDALIQANLWPLALIVFVASILVPLAKIILLMFLLLSVQLNWKTFYFERTKIYVFVEIIGKWSMLDVFLISLMTAIVQLGIIASVEPGPALHYFTIVVILTLFAAMTFDPRLIWDNQNNNLDNNPKETICSQNHK